MTRSWVVPAGRVRVQGMIFGRRPQPRGLTTVVAVAGGPRGHEVQVSIDDG
jgi:hypothetical protein